MRPKQQLVPISEASVGAPAGEYVVQVANYVDNTNIDYEKIEKIEKEIGTKIEVADDANGTSLITGRYETPQKAMIARDKVQKILEDNNVYSKPIIKGILPEDRLDFFYRVQVRAAKRQIDNYEMQKVSKNTNIRIVEKQEKNYPFAYKYLVDEKFLTKEEADKKCQELRRQGIKDAFVVPYKLVEERQLKTIRRFD